MQKEFKIIILWIVVMCGLTIHSLADLMPLLWVQILQYLKMGQHRLEYLCL